LFAKIVAPRKPRVSKKQKLEDSMIAAVAATNMLVNSTSTTSTTHVPESKQPMHFTTTTTITTATHTHASPTLLTPAGLFFVFKMCLIIFRS